MEVLWILANVILGVMLWDVHRSTREIIHIAQDLHAKTDELLRRVPPPTP